MREISASIHIDATPDQVCNTLADLAGYSRWNPFGTVGNFRLLNEALRQRVENGQTG